MRFIQHTLKSEKEANETKYVEKMILKNGGQKALKLFVISNHKRLEFSS